MRTARRSINLLTIEWANRGINLWTVEQGQIVMNTGQICYPFPPDTIDLLDQVTRTGTGSNQSDLSVTRISEPTYATIPNKNATGNVANAYSARWHTAGSRLIRRHSIGVCLVRNVRACCLARHIMWFGIDAGITNFFAHFFHAEFSHINHLFGC